MNEPLKKSSTIDVNKSGFGTYLSFSLDEYVVIFKTHCRFSLKKIS